MDRRWTVIETHGRVFKSVHGVHDDPTHAKEQMRDLKKRRPGDIWTEFHIEGSMYFQGDEYKRFVKYTRMHKDALVEMAHKAGLAMSGTKGDIAERLINA